MTQNELQLNDEKTELLLACPKKFVDHPSLPTFLEIGSTSTVPFSSSVRSLGVTLDPTLSFQQHISNVFRSAYLELRKISSVRHLLSAEATTTLVCAFIFSKLDYCTSLFQVFLNISYIDFNAYRIMLPALFLSPLNLNMSLLCFTLFTGFPSQTG